MGSDTGTLGAARDTQVTLGNTHGCGQLPWLVGSEVGGGHCQPRGGPREGGVGPYLRDRLLREGHVLALQTQREVGAWCGRGGAPIAPPSSSPFLTPPPASLCPPPHDTPIPAQPRDVPLAGGRSPGRRWEGERETRQHPAPPTTPRRAPGHPGGTTDPVVGGTQDTHPPSTISSTARKSPSMFSSSARFSTFFLGGGGRVQPAQHPQAPTSNRTPPPLQAPMAPQVPAGPPQPVPELIGVPWNHEMPPPRNTGAPQDSQVPPRSLCATPPGPHVPPP